MSDISVERIMRNIYGTAATGQITNMSGGAVPKIAFKSYAEMRPLPNVRFIDEDSKPEEPIASVSMMGGGKGRKRGNKRASNKRARGVKDSGENITIYASPEYMTHNSDLHTFIDKFFMYYRISRSPNSAIYLIPPTKVLQEMVAQRGKYPEGSIEMQNAVRTNDKIGYERYLFVTFGNNSKSDQYRIDPELTSQNAYPNSSFGTIRRTNIKGEVYYFSCDGNMKVKIHTTPTNAADGCDVKFVGRFNNGGYVFQGALPGEAIEKIAPKKENKKKHHNVNKMKFGEMPYRSNTMTGGAVNTSLRALEKYDEIYNHDHELAAEHFLRCAAKKGKLVDKYRNNGDMLYSAIYFAVSEPGAVGVDDVCNEDCGNIYKSFKPTIRGEDFRRKVNGAMTQLNNIYKRSARVGREHEFIGAYKKLYSGGDISKMTADIMTSHLRNNDTPVDAKMISSLFDAFQEPGKATRTMAALVKNAFNSAPLPSAFGAEFMPIITKMKSFESDMKANKKYKGGEDPKEEDGEDSKNLVSEIFESKPAETQDVELVMQADLTDDSEHEQLIADTLEFDSGNDSDVDNGMHEDLEQFY